MLRRAPLFVLALALWFGAEPLVHSHPLKATSNGSANVCAMCTSGIDRPVVAPAPVAPLQVVSIVDDVPLSTVATTATILLASRAPPAA
jgi:hypothetical protein